MAAGSPTKWKLGPKFANFTGLLNNVYAVRDGVVEYPAGQRPLVLIKHYGAEEVKAEVAAAPAKAAEPAKAAASAPADKQVTAPAK